MPVQESANLHSPLTSGFERRRFAFDCLQAGSDWRSYFCCLPLCAAQRRLAASAIRARPSGESLRFFLPLSARTPRPGSDSPVAASSVFARSRRSISQLICATTSLIAVDTSIDCALVKEPEIRRICSFPPSIAQKQDSFKEYLEDIASTRRGHCLRCWLHITLKKNVASCELVLLAVSTEQ